ncbi:hypothetical protein PSTG_08642 [Puccinia striiformis f. sp. tritici PST-78]|uniref:MULE transposase domain-containing protein n=1 Tax=Puccinia striiformis f. sp. tritici PST-78 TaxID=1165861 RepID=A0A0L0VFB8_9BASI|nr:hypothetical protein PSTG_08642 [Puccinia striiformis f. sp. tritici PST-78]
MASTPPNPPQAGIIVPQEVWAQMQQFMAAFGLPGPIVIPPAPAPIVTPLAQSSVIGIGEGSLIMDIDDEEDLSDPPPQDTHVDQLPEENDRQEKEDSLEDDLSVKSPGDLVVRPALRPGVITNLCEYDYNTGEPLDPPPVGQFLSMADVVAFCQEWAKHHGYTVSTGRSNANKNVYIRCGRSGDFRGQQLNPAGRQTATKKICCPFEVKGSIPTSRKIMNKVWTLEIREPEHNHEPSYSPLAHAAHKRVTLEQVIAIQKLSQSKIKPTQILIQLRTSNNETYATNKTISNVLQKQRLKDLDGRTPIQALLDILKESNWTYNVKVNSSGNILNLFFAHPGSIHLARIHHHVALLDSISTAFTPPFEDQDSYEWAVNNLKKFIWRPQRIPPVFVTNRDSALRNALAEVFPDSQRNLCTWHLTQNIVTNCKKYFGTDKNDADDDTDGRNDKKKHKKKQQKKATDKEEDESTNPWKAFLRVWGKVTNSKTPELYVTHLDELKAHLATRPAVLEYIETPMVPVKELFVVAWACQYPHLCNLNTSRVESGHAYLKRFIVNSTGDLLSVFKSLGLAVDNQINHVHESICRDTVKTLVNVPKSFVPLLGKISTFVIKECLQQFERLVNLDPTEPCSHTVTIGLGIPCAHRIRELMEDDKFVAPKDFHLQWHLRYNPEFTRTEEEEIDLDKELRIITMSLTHERPTTADDLLAQMKGIAARTHKAVTIQVPEVKKNTKGRPSTKAERLTSTKRQPSAFEIVEAKLKKEQLARKQALKAQKRNKSKRIKKNEPTEPPKIYSEDEYSPGSDLDDFDFSLLDAGGAEELLSEASDEEAEEAEIQEEKEESKKENKEESEQDNKENNHSEEENEQSGEEDDKKHEKKIEIDSQTNDKKHEKKIETDSQTNDTAANNNEHEETIVQGGGVTLLTKGRYALQIPPNLQPYITQVFDPTADGNCGFCCIARALGYKEDGWFQVRQELLKEATDHQAAYSKLQGGEETMESIIKNLEVKSKKTRISGDKWLDKMAHGQMLANAYKRPVIFLLISDCNTFLPLRAGPSEQCEPIYLLHVNGNHWILALVQGKDGVKPVPPPVLATRMTTKIAKSWLSHIQKGIHLYAKATRF